MHLARNDPLRERYRDRIKLLVKLLKYLPNCRDVELSKMTAVNELITQHRQFFNDCIQNVIVRVRPALSVFKDNVTVSNPLSREL